MCRISGCFLDALDHVSQCGVSLGVVVVVVSRIHVGTENLLRFYYGLCISLMHEHNAQDYV